MLLNADYILPVELTGYVRAALADMQINQFTLSRWLPNREIDDLMYRFTRGGEGLIEAAEFRGYDVEAGIGSRPGITRISGELPPISRKIRLGEYDRLRQRRLDQQIRNVIMDDALRMSRAIAARIELARGEALYSGKIQLSENGVTATVDFGRSAGHSVTASTVWSNTSGSVPLTDEMSWIQTYIDDNGQPPAVALVSQQIVTYMLLNAQYRNIIGRNGFVPARLSLADLNGIRDDYGMPRLEVYDARVSVNKSATRVIPVDRLIYLPAPGDPNDPEGTDLGATLLGTTAESMEPGYGMADEADQPGIVAGTYVTEDPVATWTKAALIGLPVLANPDLTMAADVA